MGGKSHSRSRSRSSRSRRKKKQEKHDRREREKQHGNRRPSGGATIREIEQSGLGTGAEKKHQNLRHLSKRGVGGVRILFKQKFYKKL